MSLPPFISQNYGANNFERIKDAFKMVAKFIVIWQVLVFVILAASADLIAQTFAEEASVAQRIKLFLYIVPLGYGLQGIIVLVNSSFNAMHKPLSALFLNIVRLFIFYVPIASIGSYLYGLEGLFWGCVIGNVATSILAYSWFNQTLNKEIALARSATESSANFSSTVGSKK
jgi:Na+-driven multidrug efflux pump